MGSGMGAGYAKVLGLLDTTIAAKLAKYHMGESPGRGKRERDAREEVVPNAAPGVDTGTDALQGTHVWVA